MSNVEVQDRRGAPKPQVITAAKIPAGTYFLGSFGTYTNELFLRAYASDSQSAKVVLVKNPRHTWNTGSMKVENYIPVNVVVTIVSVSDEPVDNE